MKTFARSLGVGALAAGLFYALPDFPWELAAFIGVSSAVLFAGADRNPEEWNGL